MDINGQYMRRALELAQLGQGTTRSNPMVGAVIVAPDGRIIGEGWHRRYGEGHAEVNAVASVKDKDRALLRESTIYVTLEPCSHYGKTPPCAMLITETGIPKAVIGTVDPFAKVSGRGIEMLREAGCEVVCGVLEDECRRLNTMFFTAHTLHRPYVVLKWAQTADAVIGIPGRRLRISTPASSVMTHRLRSCIQGILVGSGTVLADDPLLDSRLWHMGQTPRRIVIDRRGRIPADSRFFRSENIEGAVYISARRREDVSSALTHITSDDSEGIGTILGKLYDAGIISILVEGGAQLLNAFISSGIWDAARVETNPRMLAHTADAVMAPVISRAPATAYSIDGNIIQIFTNSPFADVKNL